MRQQKLWLRILLLYGSNQHFVKPVTVCQQHRRETTFPGKNNATENIKGQKDNEPINLSKSSLKSLMDSNEEVFS